MGCIPCQENPFEDIAAEGWNFARFNAETAFGSNLLDDVVDFLRPAHEDLFFVLQRLFVFLAILAVWDRTSRYVRVYLCKEKPRMFSASREYSYADIDRKGYCLREKGVLSIALGHLGK